MKKHTSLLLAFVMMLSLLPVSAFAESWVLEQPAEEQKPNRISLVELAIDALREGETPPTTATVTKVDVTRGTAQVAVEKMEWSGSFDQNGGFQKKKEYKVVVGLRITGCSDPSDPPRFTAALENANQTNATLRAGDYTTGNIPSLQPTGDKQYIEFTLGFTVLAVGDAPIPSGEVYTGMTQSSYTFAGGSGTKADPYLISTPDQLNAVRQGLDKHYRLANDIDLSAWGNWMPIGGEAANEHGEAAPFTGSFDGAGHVVSGMTITGDPWDYTVVKPGQSAKWYGLFGNVRGSEETVAPGDAYEDTTLNGVTNLGVVNYRVDFDYENIPNGPQFGAIAGRVENTRIVGCWSSGGSADVGLNGRAGGIVGISYNSVIRECWNSSAITGGYSVGGIVGYMFGPTWISHCFNTGTLAAVEGNAFGIGYGLNSFRKTDEKKELTGIMYSYNSGALSGKTATGVGFGEFMDNVYNTGALNADDPKNNSPVAGNPGFNGATPALGLSRSGERFLTDENWVDSPTLGRKVLAALREDLLTTGTAAPATPAEAETSAAGKAYPSTQTVDVDGKPREFQMYALKDAAGNPTNYVKVRDLALALSGTAAQFNVGWDGAVNLVSGTAYAANGSENFTPFGGERAYTLPTSPTNVNGAASDLQAIVLTDDAGGGYTYYQLRDLGRKLGFNVGWSAEKGVFIETDKPYAEQ